VDWAKPREAQSNTQTQKQKTNERGCNVNTSLS
jgi:hypothetical protein